MTRFLSALALVFAFASVGVAQDMPLSQILIDGEGWRKVEGKPEKPRLANPAVVIGSTGTGKRLVNAAVRASSRDTIYVSYADSDYLWAYVANAEGIIGKGARYCPLRTKPGEPSIVWSLAADKDGRIYAATELGVQVFDPTGRLCGVLTPAAPGIPNHLAFEGDALTLWVGETKYCAEAEHRRREVIWRVWAYARAAWRIHFSVTCDPRSRVFAGPSFGPG